MYLVAQLVEHSPREQSAVGGLESHPGQPFLWKKRVGEVELFDLLIDFHTHTHTVSCYTQDAPISVVGHSEDLHTRALSGLQNVLSSQEQFQTFGGENIFDPNNSNKTDTALLKALSR